MIFIIQKEGILVLDYGLNSSIFVPLVISLKFNKTAVSVVLIETERQKGGSRREVGLSGQREWLIDLFETLWCLEGGVS